MRAVTPLGEVAHVGLAAVACAGNQPSLAGSHRVQRSHAETGGDVDGRRGCDFGKAAELLHLGLSNRSKVDEAGLYAVLVGGDTRILSILAEVALG